MNVDFQEMDFGTVVRRRANQGLAGQERVDGTRATTVWANRGKSR